jgi:predicted DNA-binding protein (UPF0251 family)
LCQDPHLIDEVTAASEPTTAELAGLDRALAAIPENQRRAIVLREWHGLPYREIAATMGISQAAVEMLAFRARRSLAQILDSERAATLRSRARQAFDLSSLIAGLKTALGTISVAQVAAGAGAAALLLAGTGDATGTASRTVSIQQLRQTRLDIALATVRGSQDRPDAAGPSEHAASTANRASAPLDSHPANAPKAPTTNATSAQAPTSESKPQQSTTTAPIAPSSSTSQSPSASPAPLDGVTSAVDSSSLPTISTPTVPAPPAVSVPSVSAPAIPSVTDTVTPVADTVTLPAP